MTNMETTKMNEALRSALAAKGWTPERVLAWGGS